MNRQINASSTDDGLNFYESGHRFEHSQLLLVLLRSLPYASMSLQSRALQESSSKCFNSSRASRISLVDLAGSDRNKLDGTGIQCLRETKNVKKSLSQLEYDA